MFRGSRRARRAAAARRIQPVGFGSDAVDDRPGRTPLHDERLEAVAARLLWSGATSVLDLGCGSGALLERLVAEERLTRIVGIDTSGAVLLEAERALARLAPSWHERVSLVHGSFVDADARLAGFDAAVMVETIEHVRPDDLPEVESAVFAVLRPRLVLVTTPNREYNPLLGGQPDALRHPDHHFEWDRVSFEAWAGAVAERNDYGVTFEAIGPVDAWLGSPTQMAVFLSNRPGGDGDVPRDGEPDHERQGAAAGPGPSERCNGS